MDVTPQPAPPRAIQRGRVRKAGELQNLVSDLEAALQKRERASAAHERVVQAITRLADLGALSAEETQHIDVLVRNICLMEVKSLQRDDPQQIRDGVAQLLYYRFLYRALVKDSKLLLMLGRKPGSALKHLVAFARDCGISVAWQIGDHFETDDQLEESLKWLLAT